MKPSETLESRHSCKRWFFNAFDDALLQVQVGYTFRHPWQVRRREVAHGFSFFCASATALNNGSIALE